MKNWAKYTVLNASMALGFFLIIFLLPPSTHFLPVLIACLLFLGFANYWLFKRLRESNFRINRAESVTMVVIVLLILLFDLLLSRLTPG